MPADLTVNHQEGLKHLQTFESWREDKKLKRRKPRAAWEGERNGIPRFSQTGISRLRVIAKETREAVDEAQ